MTTQAAENLVCNVCEKPTTYDVADDVRLVPSNVRKFQQEQFTVWRCRNCQSLHSKEAVDLEHYYSFYPYKNHSLNIYTRLAYRNRLRSLMQKGLRKTQSILDFGCGEGLFVQFLKDKGYHGAKGYDPYNSEFNHSKVLEQEYDMICTYDVIEHVPEPREMLKQLESVLKLGGQLIIGTPNASRIDLRDKGNPSPELHQPYHQHILSEQALIELATALHLQPIDSTDKYFWDTPFPLVNTRFIWSYVHHMDDCVDSLIEPILFSEIFRKPRLLMHALFGYWIPVRIFMFLTFRKAEVTSKSQENVEEVHTYSESRKRRAG